MTETSSGHGAGKGAARARRLALAPPSQVMAPWRDIMRHLTSSTLAMIPLLIMLADELHLSDQWPWVAGALAIVAAVARVMNTPQGERFIAKFMPWLSAEDYQLPPLARPIDSQQDN